MKLFVVLALGSASLFAQTAPTPPETGGVQKFNHASWTAVSDSQSIAPGSTFLVKLQADIDADWHMYSLTTPPGPIPTSISAVDSPAISQVALFEPPPIRKFDPNFNADTETYEGSQIFYAKVTLGKDAQPGPVTLTFEPRYQTCSGTSCIPPRKRRVSVNLTIAAGAPQASLTIPANYIEAKPGAPAPRDSVTSTSVQDSAIVPFLALAFGFGLAAVFTPCVFPMIPITMSYFVGQKGGFAQAITFCVGIVVLFTGLGLLATIALGPAGVNHIGANVWVNLFITLIFFIFGLSLLGAFEITIPSGILTKLNSASGQGGYIGTLLMGLTFALASFACVGPFMGTLLAASVTGGKLRPVLGMVSFSSGLSSPFFLLALFPAWLKKLPRSGEWMARVKVVMGFLVMAAMLKYLHNVDDAFHWGILTRERFLALWVVLALLTGLYLLGFVRLEGISADAELGVPRLLLGIVIIAAGLSLVPGMFGARLGDIEAYIPPATSNIFGGGGAPAEQLAWLENDLDGAFAKAKAENKRVLVDFTGDACTNCKWMKANLFVRPEVSSVMKNMVLVELYTDRSDPVSEKFQQLEADQFKTVAIPFYVVYDSDRTVLATFPDRTDDSSKYISFLNTPAKAGAAPQTNVASTALEGGPLRALDGSPLNMSAWKGKFVVVNYWATWCIPCRKEIPEFNRMQAELGPKGVEVVGISMDEEGAEAVNPFLKQIPVKYTLGLGTGTIAPLPVTLIIDRNGKTVKRFEGLQEAGAIRAAVEKALSAG
jgi:thiol:disulfide interchange protein DsbD